MFSNLLPYPYKSHNDNPSEINEYAEFLNDWLGEYDDEWNDFKYRYILGDDDSIRDLIEEISK